MGQFDMQIGPSLSDLMNQKAMQQAQIGAMGQESQLRQLQMQQAQQGQQDTAQLRSLLPELMKSGDPMQSIKSLMGSGNPGAIEMAGKLVPLMAAMQKDNSITYEDFGGYKQGKNSQGQLVGDRIEKTSSPREFQPSDLARLTTEMNNLNPNDPRVPMYRNAITKLTTHQPASTQINYANGPLQPGKTAQGKIDEALLDSGNRKMRLNDIETSFKPEYLQLGTRLQSAMSNAKSKMGIPLSAEDTQSFSEYSKFKASALSNLNQYIKEITGAAMSEAEATRIRAALPDPGEGILDGDSPILFKSKLTDALRQVKMAEARLVYMKRTGMSMFDGEGNPAITLEKMPLLMNERGQKIEAEIKSKNPNIDTATLRKFTHRKLALEFGLAE